MLRVYDLYTCTHIVDGDYTCKSFVVRMRDNECRILWVWHRKVGQLTAMIPVGVIFITFKQPQGAFLSTVFYCKLTAALPVCTVVTFASDKDLLTLG